MAARASDESGAAPLPRAPSISVRVRANQRFVAPLPASRITSAITGRARISVPRSRALTSQCLRGRRPYNIQVWDGGLARRGAGRRINGLFRHPSHPLHGRRSVRVIDEWQHPPRALPYDGQLVSDVLSHVSLAGLSLASRCRAFVAQPLGLDPRVTHPSCSGGSPESRSIPSVMASRLKSRQGSLI